MKHNFNHPQPDPAPTPKNPRISQPILWQLLLTLAGFSALVLLLIFSLDNAANKIAALRQQTNELSTFQKTPAPSEEPATEYVTNKKLEVKLPAITLTGSYSGDLVGGVPEGKGRFVFGTYNSTDMYYDGEWKGGLFDGYGTMHPGEGLVYEGDYANGMRNGVVKLYDLHGNFLSVSEYQGDRPVYTDTAYCKTLLDAFKNGCHWAYTPDYFGDAMGHAGTKVIVSGYVDKVVENGSASYLEFCPDQVYDVVFVVRVLDLEYQEAKLSEGDYATLYAVIDGIAPYKNKDGRDAMGTSLSAYSYVLYRPNTQEVQASKLDAAYLNGVWSPDPDAVAYSGWVYEFSGSKLVVYDYVNTFLYATFDGTYRFLENGELHHSYNWKQFDKDTGEITDSYKGRLNYSLHPLTQDVIIIRGELYYRLGG